MSIIADFFSLKAEKYPEESALSMFIMFLNSVW